ncbi:MAG TPA: hypothetical protein VI932_00430 [Bacteroidota bacterium]|nr:hypothetical protein [Bacteroidota bacterium]
MNPNIGDIVDLQGIYTDYGNRKLKFQFEEAEIFLISTIDPYVKADIFVSYVRTPVCVSVWYR